MKRFFADEERIEFNKDEKAVLKELISDTRRIYNDKQAGHKDGFEIFDDYFDLLGGTICPESFSVNYRTDFRVPLDGRNMNFFSEESKKVKKTYDWKDKTILIAEDEETNFLYLKAALSRTHAKILHAKTGNEVVSLYKSNDSVDIILMDIKMPEMNGIEATIAIRSINKNVKIIAQTAYAMEDDKKLYFQAGCIDYLAKPIHRDQLLHTISKYI